MKIINKLLGLIAIFGLGLVHSPFPRFPSPFPEQSHSIRACTTKSGETTVNFFHQEFMRFHPGNSFCCEITLGFPMFPEGEYHIVSFDELRGKMVTEFLGTRLTTPAPFDRKFVDLAFTAKSLKRLKREFNKARDPLMLDNSRYYEGQVVYALSELQGVEIKHTGRIKNPYIVNELLQRYTHLSEELKAEITLGLNFIYLPHLVDPDCEPKGLVHVLKSGNTIVYIIKDGLEKKENYTFEELDGSELRLLYLLDREEGSFENSSAQTVEISKGIKLGQDFFALLYCAQKTSVITSVMGLWEFCSNLQVGTEVQNTQSTCSSAEVKTGINVTDHGISYAINQLFGKKTVAIDDPELTQKFLDLVS